MVTNYHLAWNLKSRRFEVNQKENGHRSLDTMLQKERVKIEIVPRKAWANILQFQGATENKYKVWFDKIVWQQVNCQFWFTKNPCIMHSHLNEIRMVIQRKEAVYIIEVNMLSPGCRYIIICNSNTNRKVKHLYRRGQDDRQNFTIIMV